jgi:hypothetical protein
LIRSERSRLGKIEKVQKNYWRGGDCPFGYKLENTDGVGNKLNMTNTEMAQVVAFLKTLGGSNIYTDKKWSNPFLNP